MARKRGLNKSKFLASRSRSLAPGYDELDHLKREQPPMSANPETLRRTFSHSLDIIGKMWLARYRRLLVRYERRADIHEAFLRLGCALICPGYA